MRKLVHGLVLALSLGLALTALPAVARADAAAEIKAGSGIENRELTGVGATFKKGDTVYVQANVTGANAGDTVTYVWKRDGKEARRANLPVKAAKWRTNAKWTSIGTGSYVVEVSIGDKKLGEISFKVE